MTRIPVCILICKWQNQSVLILRVAYFHFFQSLYFKVSDYGSRMNVGSVSIPASGFCALIWHGDTAPVSGHRWQQEQVITPEPGAVAGVSGGAASRDTGAGAGMGRGRDGVTPDRTSGAECPGPGLQSSSVILCILSLSWLHLPCLQSPVSYRTSAGNHRTRHHHSGDSRAGPTPRPRSGWWIVIFSKVWRLLCLLYRKQRRIKFSFEIQEPLSLCKVIHTRHNWCQIFLQLLNFEQVLVKGGCEAPEAGPPIHNILIPNLNLEYCLLCLSVILRILDWSALIWQNGNSEQNMQLAKTIKNIFHYESFGETFEHTLSVTPDAWRRLFFITWIPSRKEFKTILPEHNC